MQILAPGAVVNGMLLPLGDVPDLGANTATIREEFSGGVIFSASRDLSEADFRKLAIGNGIKQGFMDSINHMELGAITAVNKAKLAFW